MKTIDRFLSLAAAVLLCHPVSAQTVYASGTTYTAGQLRTGLLADKSYVSVQGTWSPSQIDSLAASLHTAFNWATWNVTGNDVLTTLDMEDAVFTGDSISLKGIGFGCSKLREVILPSTAFDGKVCLTFAFASCTYLYRIEHLDKLNGICDLSSAFALCSNLTSVRFSAPKNRNSVSFSAAFSQCRQLQHIENLDSFIKIKSLSMAFNQCESLTEVLFSSSLKGIGEESYFMSTFSGCKNLTRIDNLDRFANLYSSGPVYFSEAFKGCSKLDSVRLRPDSTHLINLRRAFEGCYNLRKFNSGDLVFSTLDHAFKGCTKLEEFACNPHSANHDELVDMSSAFSGCSSLKIPASSAFCYKKIYGIDSCFYQCGNLEEVRFTTPQAYWMPAYSMFEWCWRLRIVYGFENFTDLNSLRRTFANCERLEEVHLGTNPNQLSSSSLEDTFYRPNAPYTVSDGHIPSNIKIYVKTGGPGCVKYLPDGVTTVPADWINYGYKNFVVPITITANKTELIVDEGRNLSTGLSSNGITITASPEYANIDSIFWEINSYGTHEEWDPVDGLRYGFSRYDDRGRLMLSIYNRKSYYTKEFSVSVNPKAIVCYDRNGNVTFSRGDVPTDESEVSSTYVEKAYKIRLGGTWTNLQLHYVFARLHEYPDSLREFDAYFVSPSEPVNYYNVFKNHRNLTKVTFPSSGSVSNMYCMFENCTKLTYVDFGSNFWSSSASMMRNAVRNCSSLQTVILPGMTGGTNNTHQFTADSAFLNCSKLKRIYRLEYLVRYNDMSSMFRGCSALEDLHIGADVSGLAANKSQRTFDGVPDALVKWLPASCPDVPDPWKNYRNFVLPLHITLTGTLQAIRYTTNFTQGLSAGAVYTIGPAYAYVPSGDSNFAVGVYPNSNPSSSAVFPNATEIVSNYAGNGSYVNVWRYNGNDWYSSNLIPVRMNDTWSIKVKATRDLGVFEAPLGLRLIKGDGRYWYGTRDVLDFNDA